VRAVEKDCRNPRGGLPPISAVGYSSSASCPSSAGARGSTEPGLPLEHFLPEVTPPREAGVGGDTFSPDYCYVSAYRRQGGRGPSGVAAFDRRAAGRAGRPSSGAFHGPEGPGGGAGPARLADPVPEELPAQGPGPGPLRGPLPVNRTPGPGGHGGSLQGP